jgi:hypothetical protein
MGSELLFAVMLAIFSVGVATTQIRGVKGATTRSFTLYGSIVGGWGFTAGSISSLGPTIEVEQGDTVNLTLISQDVVHRFFVSYTNVSSPSVGDPQSPDFSGTINFQFVASDTVGTYKYYCFFHPLTMWGYFRVFPTGGIPEFQPSVMLSLLVIGTLAIALTHKRKQVMR